jgi:hypothetical protein
VAPKSQQLQIRVTPAQKATLKRLARRAGLDVSSYVLARIQPPVRTRIAGLIGALGRAPDRFAFAGLNDVLAGLAPAEFRDAVADLSMAGLSPLVQNYVAAMVEQTAHRVGETPPPWVRDIEPLERPYFAAGFSSLRPYLLRAAPVAFKRRNLFVDGDRV